MHHQFTPKQVARFWARVDTSGECWIWTGARFVDGYGMLRVERRGLHAHRVAWEMARGTVSGDLCVCHRCDVRLCCNPDHLFLGTRADNNADRDAKGRTRNVGVQGERHWNARLTAEKVVEMRRLYAAGGVSLQQLALRFGVHLMTAQNAVSGTTWAHLPAVQR